MVTSQFLSRNWTQYSLCGLVVTVPGNRSRDPGFDSRRYRIFWEVVGLERGPSSIVSITEGLIEINGRGDLLR
jgi:hypothetical protein